MPLTNCTFVSEMYHNLGDVRCPQCHGVVLQTFGPEQYGRFFVMLGCTVEHCPERGKITFVVPRRLGLAQETVLGQIDLRRQ